MTGGKVARDPSMTTSGDPRRDQPFGGGGFSGPRPDVEHKVRTGDRNARGSQEQDSKGAEKPDVVKS